VVAFWGNFPVVYYMLIINNHVMWPCLVEWIGHIIWPSQAFCVIDATVRRRNRALSVADTDS